MAVRRYLIAALVVVVSVIVVLTTLWTRPVRADIRTSEPIDVDGTPRNFRIAVPHEVTTPSPVVFAFHGLGDSAESMADYSGLDKLAAANGFILVYPTARKSMWATVNATMENLSSNRDIRFFDALLSDLSDRYEIDPARIYVVGMSNGASFAQLLATARSDVIAALVAHSGSRPTGIDWSARTPPIMLVAGRDDPAFAAMQDDANQYRNRDYPSKFLPLDALGHEWSEQHNDEFWEFLSAHTVE